MEVTSNGSTWYEQRPAPIERLLELLVLTPLDPRFEDYGNFIKTCEDGTIRLFGNFFIFSHVFNIKGSQEELAKVIEAIKANLASPDYAEAKDIIRIRAEVKQASPSYSDRFTGEGKKRAAESKPIADSLRTRTKTLMENPAFVPLMQRWRDEDSNGRS